MSRDKKTHVEKYLTALNQAVGSGGIFTSEELLSKINSHLSPMFKLSNTWQLSYWLKKQKKFIVITTRDWTRTKSTTYNFKKIKERT